MAKCRALPEPGQHSMAPGTRDPLLTWAARRSGGAWAWCPPGFESSSSMTLPERSVCVCVETMVGRGIRAVSHMVLFCTFCSLVVPTRLREVAGTTRGAAAGSWLFGWGSCQAPGTMMAGCWNAAGSNVCAPGIIYGLYPKTLYCMVGRGAVKQSWGR